MHEYTYLMCIYIYNDGSGDGSGSVHCSVWNTTRRCLFLPSPPILKSFP